MSGRLHTKTATLTLLRDFSSAPEKLSEWFARGFRTAPERDSSTSEPGSLSDALKKLRCLLEQSAPQQEHQKLPKEDQHYQDLLEEIQKAGVLSTRELPEIIDKKRSRPLTQEHITEHLFTDHESLARLRKAIGHINTADQNNHSNTTSHEFFSVQISDFIEKSTQNKTTEDHRNNISLALLR
ncbi:MAG: hypothetical protein AB8G05_20320 [Oligoflexales bacterium]